MSAGGVAGCSDCGGDHPFELPPELLKAALKKKLVIFAGAGVSTESRRVFPQTFAEEIAGELGGTVGDRTFPEVMTSYEDKFGRRQLLQRIWHRFDYMNGFPDLLTTATRFHTQLATAFFLDEIVTTNWDTHFEEYTAAIPVVIREDYAFSDISGRKVFKLHGSMHNLSTIVATESDYDKCYKRLRTGTIGATLKHLLATKRVVFVGYSFGDPDLNRILSFMRSELADILPRSFVVTPHGYDGDDFPQDRIIRTDGAYFIRKLKDAAVDLELMRPDTVYARMARLSKRVRRANLRVTKSFDLKDDPNVIHSLSYQGGLLHAFARIDALEPSGHYSNPHSTHVKLDSYERLRRGAIRKRQYFDAAYIQGYQYGLMSLDFDDETTKTLPLFFIWGLNRDLLEFEDFAGELKRAPRLHKAATAEAKRLVSDLEPGLTVQHTPFLSGVHPV